MRKTLYGAVMALLLGAGSAAAHHAFANDFDRDQPVTLTGAITKVQWANPHVYTFMNVKDDHGKMANWKVEMGSPADLTQAGWTRTTLKAGQMVTLNGWRAKNGTNFANAEEMTLPGGQKLSAASSIHQGEREGVPTSGTGKPKIDRNAPDVNEPQTVRPY